MTSAPWMTSTPAARAALINGVFDGSATTSNTVRASVIARWSKACSAASGAAAIPRGVGLLARPRRPRQPEWRDVEDRRRGPGADLGRVVVAEPLGQRTPGVLV